MAKFVKIKAHSGETVVLNIEHISSIVFPTRPTNKPYIVTSGSVNGTTITYTVSENMADALLKRLDITPITSTE